MSAGDAADIDCTGLPQFPVSPSPPQVEHLNCPFHPVPLQEKHLVPARAIAVRVKPKTRVVTIFFIE